MIPVPPCLPGDTDDPLVVIVDEDPALRGQLKELLLSIGIESTSFSSPGSLMATDIPDRPGCIVTEVRMRGMSGLDLQRRWAAEAQSRPFVFLTGYGDIVMATEAMKAGAVDFLTKPARDDALIDAVIEGIERDRARRENARILKSHLDRLASLTYRERQVLSRVAAGRLNKQIAFDLGVSEITVKFHRGNAMRKMNAASIGQIIRIWNLVAPHVGGAMN